MTAPRRLDHPDLPVPLIRVQGTPAECGHGYGSAARDLIVANLDFYLRRFRDEAGLSTAAVRAAGLAFRTATLRHHPRVAELLDGVADGAGTDVGEIYALNARTELLYGQRRAGVDGSAATSGIDSPGSAAADSFASAVDSSPRGSSRPADTSADRTATRPLAAVPRSACSAPTPRTGTCCSGRTGTGIPISGR